MSAQYRRRRNGKSQAFVRFYAIAFAITVIAVLIALAALAAMAAVAVNPKRILPKASGFMLIVGKLGLYLAMAALAAGVAATPSPVWTVARRCALAVADTGPDLYGALVWLLLAIGL